MELKETLKKLHASNEFKTWQKEHNSYYLAHAFMMLDDINKETWQIGYYSKETDRIVTFIVSPREICATQEQEVMKAKQAINELNPDKIKTSTKEALETSQKCINEHYKNELITKSFFIIQTINSIPTYNITYLTQGFKTINIKINAIDGKIIQHTKGVLAEFS